MARNAIKPIENKHVRPMAQVSTDRVRIPEVPIPCEPVIYLRESSTFFTPWFTYAEWSLRFMQHMPSEFLQLCSWANSRKSMAAQLHSVAGQTEPHQWASLLRVLMLLFFFFFPYAHSHTLTTRYNLRCGSNRRPWHPSVLRSLKPASLGHTVVSAAEAWVVLFQGTFEVTDSWEIANCQKWEIRKIPAVDVLGSANRLSSFKVHFSSLFTTAPPPLSFSPWFAEFFSICTPHPRGQRMIQSPIQSPSGKPACKTSLCKNRIVFGNGTH